MKNLILKVSTLFSLLVIMTSCNSNAGGDSTAVTIDKEQIKKEIQARENLYAKIYN